MRRLIALMVLSLITHESIATSVVNVYAWGGEIPNRIIHQFEKESGIQVHFSTYDSNETLYTKLKAATEGLYDVILPSSYYVERMVQQNMLQPLDHNQLSNLNNLDAKFIHNDFDDENKYSVPLLWGATGIFYNHSLVRNPPTSWSSLWEKQLKNQLLLLDDSREIFSIALMRLGYSPNDTAPQHIEQAYEQLSKLIPNIKLFSSEGIQSILIDEDASAGVVWNGDAFKAHAENKSIEYLYPKEGFVLWVDNLAIPNKAPHLKEAYAFINFLLRANVAKQIGLIQGHAITNAAGKALLPSAIRHDPMLYPSKETMKHGYFQHYPGEETIALLNAYWQQLKLAF